MIKVMAECPHCHQTTMTCAQNSFTQPSGDVCISIEDISFALDDEVTCQHCEGTFFVNIEVSEDALF